MNCKQLKLMIMLIVLAGSFLVTGYSVGAGGESGGQLPELPDGWLATGTHPQDYEMGIDRIVTYSGKASVYIKSKVSEPRDFGTLAQKSKADDYCGKRVRMSAYVKAEKIENWAGLWMRVDGPENKALSFDNMQDRPIKGTIDWRKYEIVLDVPENSVNIAFGILLVGKGQAWIDDLQFEVVGKDVPTTNLLVESGKVSPPSINLEDILNGRSVSIILVKDFMRIENTGIKVFDVDFKRYFPVVDTEQIVIARWASAWSSNGDEIPISILNVKSDPEGNMIHTYRLEWLPSQEQVLVTITSLVARHERPAPVGEFTIPDPGGYPLEVKPFLSSTEMVSSDHMEIKELAEELLKETNDAYEIAVKIAQIMKGKSYKQKKDSEKNLPTAVKVLRYGGSCCSSAVCATAIFRACGIPAQVTYCPPVCYLHGITQFYLNGYGWVRMDSTCGAGKLPLIQNEKDVGLVRLFDMPIEMEKIWYAYAWPYYHNDLYGKYKFLSMEKENSHIHFARAEKVIEPFFHYEPGSWNKVLGTEPYEGAWESWDVLASESREAIIDKNLGEFHSLIEKLPVLSKYIEEAREFEFTVIGSSVGTGGGSDGKLPDGWLATGSHPQDYEMGIDRIVTYSGKASVYIKSKVSEPRDFGTLAQKSKADDYCGKRVRMSAYVKAEKIENWAGLWMRVDGPENKALSFDNMQDRPIKGTIDWRKYEIVLDVPENSVNIAFGILLVGKGQAWIDDLQFEVVGKDVPTTK